MDDEALLLEKEDLVRLAKIEMPFGKYKGSLLIDLPDQNPTCCGLQIKGFLKAGWVCC